VATVSAAAGAASWRRIAARPNASHPANAITSATITPRLANAQAPVLPPSPNGPSRVDVEHRAADQYLVPFVIVAVLGPRCGVFIAPTRSALDAWLTTAEPWDRSREPGDGD
jgi:hypothetical protein